MTSDSDSRLVRADLHEPPEAKVLVGPGARLRPCLAAGVDRDDEGPPAGGLAVWRPGAAAAC